MTLALRIALRYLFARKGHTAVNVISWMAMGGVAVATAAMVCVLSVFNGFSDLAMSRLSRLSPDVMLTPERGKMLPADADSLVRAIEAVEGVALAAPVLDEQGLARAADLQTPVTLRGVDGRWRRVVGIDSVVVDGLHAIDAPEGGFATISAAAAVKLGMTPSGVSRLELYVPRHGARVNPANPLAAFAADTLRVTAVWQTFQPEFDEPTAVVPIGRLQRQLGRGAGEATAVYVALKPGADAGATLARLRAALPAGVQAADRLEQHETSFRMIRIEKWASFLMLAFIMAIASFNIVSTLSMLVIEKRGGMWLLSALGARRGLIDRVYVIEGWLVGLAGAVAGLAVGAALSLAQQWWGLVKLAGDPSQMSVTAYPARLAPVDLLYVLGVAVATSLVTGLVTLALRKTPEGAVRDAVTVT